MLAKINIFLKVKYVHMLNATMCAATRVICAILENNQEDDGVRVPKALKSLMPVEYAEKIPFVRPAPIDQMPSGKSTAKNKGNWWYFDSNFDLLIPVMFALKIVKWYTS